MEGSAQLLPGRGSVAPPFQGGSGTPSPVPSPSPILLAWLSGLSSGLGGSILLVRVRSPFTHPITLSKTPPFTTTSTTTTTSQRRLLPFTSSSFPLPRIYRHPSPSPAHWESLFLHSRRSLTITFETITTLIQPYTITL
jgi:hypothetical protein